MTHQDYNHLARPWSISIRGIELKGLEWGDPQAPPMLALHGWQDNAASFIPLMSHLSRLDNFRVIAPDLVGHGQSSWRPQRSAYHFVDWLRDVHDLLEALEWSTCTIIGHSMGGAIASLWAGLYPERCTDLILIEGLGPLTTSATETPDQLAKALQTPVYPFKKRSSIEQLVKQRSILTPMRSESARLLMERSTRKLSDNQIQLCQDPMLRMPSMLRFTEEQVHAFLKRITCDVLLIVAQNGWPFDPQLMRERVTCISSYDVKSIEGQHHVHMDEPAQVAQLCGEFLKGM